MFRHDFTNQRKQSNLLLQKIENQLSKDQEKDLKIEKKKLKQHSIVSTAHDLLIRNYQRKSFQSLPRNQILSTIMKRVSKKKKTSLNSLQMKYRKSILD